MLRFAEVPPSKGPLGSLILVVTVYALLSAPPIWGQVDSTGATPSSRSGQILSDSENEGPELHVGSRLQLPEKNSKYDVSRIGDREVGKGMNFYSLERERAMGKELADSLEAHAQLIKDPVITTYVNRIGQSIVRNSDAKVPFIIKVINDDEVNALALPGGYFYVNSGLILAAENEAELAGVMAHEIAHVAARHATRTATKGELWNMASIPLLFAGGPVGFAVRQAASLAVPMSFLKFSRDSEREADLLGLEYSYASGYDPAAFVQFFERLSAKEKRHPGLLAKAFSTHPMNGDRVRRAQDEIQTLLPARDQYLVNTSEFDEVKAHLAALLNLSSPVNSNRPTLRKSSSHERDDGRPTLHRRMEQEQGTSSRNPQEEKREPTTTAPGGLPNASSPMLP